MKQRFPPVLITTCQILQPVWRSIEVILYAGKGQFERQLWFPGKTPLDFAKEMGETEMVNLLMGKASWLHELRSMQ